MKYTYMTLIIAAALTAGCGGNKEEAPAGPPPMPVSAILAKATKTTQKDTVDIVGSLTARDEVTIISELDAAVTAVKVKEGQRVKKGDILFQLDGVKTKAMLADTEASHKLAELTHNRNKGLLKNNTISQQSFDEAEADLKSKKARQDLARDDHSKTTIKAPFAGMAGERSVSTGQFVTRGQELLSLVMTDPLDIVGDVPERYMSSLKHGLKVEFKSEAYPDKTFNAKVIYVSPSLAAASRTVRIKAETTNSDNLLKPGMFGKMSIILSERNDSLSIPESCIQMQGDNMMVMRVDKDGISGFAPVQTGNRSKGFVEIVSGLDEGDLVIAEGWQKMGPGTPVAAAPGSEKYGVEMPAPETGDEETGEQK